LHLPRSGKVGNALSLRTVSAATLSGEAGARPGGAVEEAGLSPDTRVPADSPNGTGPIRTRAVPQPWEALP